MNSTQGGVDVRAGEDEKQKINFAWPDKISKTIHFLGIDAGQMI